MMSALTSLTQTCTDGAEYAYKLLSAAKKLYINRTPAERGVRGVILESGDASKWLRTQYGYRSEPYSADTDKPNADKPNADDRKTSLPSIDICGLGEEHLEALERHRRFVLKVLGRDDVQKALFDHKLPERMLQKKLTMPLKADGRMRIKLRPSCQVHVILPDSDLAAGRLVTAPGTFEDILPRSRLWVIGDWGDSLWSIGGSVGWSFYATRIVVDNRPSYPADLALPDGWTTVTSLKRDR